jgi:hypothetical protein
MAKSNVWNGVLLGMAFALLAFYAASSITQLSFVASMVNGIAEWLAKQTWMDWFTFGYLNYVVAALIGAAIGLWVEYK